MTKPFIVNVLSVSSINSATHAVKSFRYESVNEADAAANKARKVCSDRSKYLITVCHEDCGLLGTF